MSSIELLSFPDAESLAGAAAKQWLMELETVTKSAAPYCIALSGGRIARTFFSAAVAHPGRQDSVWNSVYFFWADERCVPPADPESNFGVASELLLKPLNIPEGQVHRIRGEERPEVGAAQAEASLRRLAPASAGGPPVLDLVFLGMGEDGHVASLFPGEPEEVMAGSAAYRAVVAAKPPPHRITIGYSVLAAARQVWVLASGPGKAAALRESLTPSGRTPLARVLALRTRTRIFSDIPT